MGCFLGGGSANKIHQYPRKSEAPFTGALIVVVFILLKILDEGVVERFHLGFDLIVISLECYEGG